MSAVDLREPQARVPGSASPAEPPVGHPRSGSRSRWIAALLVAGFMATLPVELNPEASEIEEVFAIETLGTALPLHTNERVDFWLKRFQTTGRPEFAGILVRSGAYADMIRGKLRARGMPEELLYLAMMESGLLPAAVSKVFAVGVWQFMGPTAVQYGLRVDEFVDERRDPVRATDAALDYLESLYTRFGSWYLAAAAYNAGPGRVEGVLGSHAGGRTGDEDLYWEVLDHLPPETRDYVPRLIAATILAQDADAFGFTDSKDAPYRYDQVFVPGGTSLARVAQILDVDMRLLRDLNLHLIRGITPPGEMFGVRVPVGGSASVVYALSAGPNASRFADDD